MSQDDTPIIEYLQAVFGDEAVARETVPYFAQKMPCHSIRFEYAAEDFTGSEHKKAFFDAVRTHFETKCNAIMQQLGLRSKIDAHEIVQMDEENTEAACTLRLHDEALSRALPKLKTLKKEQLDISEGNSYCFPNSDFERDDAVAHFEQFIPKLESHRLLEQIFGEGTVQHLPPEDEGKQELYCINFQYRNNDDETLQNQVKLVGYILCEKAGISPMTTEYVQRAVQFNTTSKNIFLYLPVDEFEEQSVRDKLVELTADSIGLTRLLSSYPLTVHSFTQLTADDSDGFGNDSVVGQYLHDQNNDNPAQTDTPRADALEKLQRLFDQYKEVDWEIDPDKEAFVLKRNDGKPMHEPAIIAYYLLEDMQKDGSTADTYAEKGCVVLPFHHTDAINAASLAIHKAYDRAMDAMQPTHLPKRRPQSAAGQGLE